MSIISLKNISKIYGKDNSKTIALNSINLDIEKGDFISIMGQSGCGKSTLLNIIGCIDTPNTGEYYLNGDLIDFKKINKLSNIRNSEMGFIFQKFALIEDLTVIENVVMPLNFRKIPKKEKISLAEKYLLELDILNLRNRNIKELSGGQQQRVAIARALAQETNIILADEPTGSLDAKNGIIIMEILEKLNKQYNKTIIVVTHDNNVAAFTNKTIILHDGEIVS